MQKTFFSLLILFLFFSCKNSDDAAAEPLSTFQLTEVYADPGDLSGGFAKVNSNRQIAFYPDGLLQTKGDLCNLQTTSDVMQTHRYDLEKLYLESCNNGLYQVPYEVTDKTLIVYYLCREPCWHKYTLVE